MAGFLDEIQILIYLFTTLISKFRVKVAIFTLSGTCFKLSAHHLLDFNCGSYEIPKKFNRKIRKPPMMNQSF